ncbi:MAG: NUDIX hydrolase [Candidatus Thiodiazotropha taylori]|nr:NUDIX hydrolase [Candidatus Thiodiazotropha taylori]
MNFCSQCGAKVEVKVPDGDNRPRHVCDSCSTIHYQNPKIVVGCIPVWEDQILLCRRAIEPRYGLWTLPAGFMENGETSQQGAARETLEEATARVDVEGLYGLYNLPHINQVYLIFRSRLLDLEFAAGTESLEVALFKESEIPWQEMAFPVIRESLKIFFEDRQKGTFPLRGGTIIRNQQNPRGYQMVMDRADFPSQAD